MKLNEFDCLIICFCANWCRVCQNYMPEFFDLSVKYYNFTFHWIDIEDQPDLIEDEDIESFPTLLIQLSGKTVFFGTLLPHIHYLERLILSVCRGDLSASNEFPDMRTIFLNKDTLISNKRKKI